jgi:protein-S-isoprenylcysteine O-methyltransferase Ste14
MDARENGTPEAAQARVKRGVMRWAFRETMGVAMTPVVLCLCAGRWDWRPAWALTGVLALWAVSTVLAVIPRNPALLAERTSRAGKGGKSWDMAIVSIVGALGFAVLIVAGLDERYGWTASLPAVWPVVGLLTTLAGYALIVWATASNAFFSLIVRVQSERGHRVIKDGPYRFVRHPGYVGGLLTNLGTPILLGSLWAFLPGAVAALLLIARTALEDRMLQAELPGYREYATETRYRLIPGIW